MAFENIYQQDITKKKVLYISSTNITVNGSTLKLSSPGNSTGTISNGQIISITILFYPVDPYSTSNSTVSITDSEYTYSVSAEIISKTFNGIMDGMTESLTVSNTWTSNGQTYNQYTYTISGTTSNIDYSTYNLVTRFSLTCTDSSGTIIRVDNTDESITFNTDAETQNSFYWDTAWLASLPKDTDISSAYVLFSGGLGSYIDIGVRIDNQTNENISYEITAPYQAANFNLPTVDYIPLGISILSNGVFGGSISLTSNVKKYYFSISCSIDNNGTIDYGDPSTLTTIFCIVVQDYVSTEISQFNQINWKTAAGNLGTIYDGYPSFFSVVASTSSGNSVSYSLSPYSSALPSGILINSDGTITGTFPFVQSVTEYNFTVRAQYGSYYSDRSFSITCDKLYGTSDFFNIHLPVFNDTKTLLQTLASNISQSDIFRPNDSNFGLVSNYMIYMISGLIMTDDIIGFWDNTLDSTSPLYGVGQDISVITKATQDNFYSCLIDKLRNYHHHFEVTISGLSSAPYYSIDGDYICDVVYLNISDHHDYSGCFSSTGVEKLVTYSIMDDYEIDYMNVPANNEGRIFTPSITNCRYDLLETTNRINTPTYMIRPNATAGIGLVGNEGMPMWMMNTSSSNLGYVAAIPLVYITAGNGNSVVSSLKTTSSYSSIIGKSWMIDRYIMETKTPLELEFVDTVNNTQKEIMFDNGTTLFDVSYEPSYRYLFFPKLGDV